mgnify:CR=1 FL=1
MKRILPLIAALGLASVPPAAADSVDLLGGSSTSPQKPSEPPPAATPAPTHALGSLDDLSADADGGARAALLVSLALERLAGLELLLAAVPPGVERDAALVELAGLRQALHGALVEVGRLREASDLRAWLAAQGLGERAPSGTTKPAASPAVPVDPVALTTAEFTDLCTSIDGVAFTTGKMEVLVQGLQSRRVNTAQARALMELFSFSRDRVDALIFLHPRVQDPENFDGLLSALKFESDRASVRSQLGLDG